MQKQKGFTIIELIVVIAIIAVLASIVLVNVTQYIAKSKNSAIKGNMSTLLTNSAVFYDDPTPTYTGFKADTAIGCASSIATAITSAGSTLNCYVGTTAAAGTTFCACAVENVTSGVVANTVYCIDSTGNKKEVVNANGCGDECQLDAVAACK